MNQTCEYDRIRQGIESDFGSAMGGLSDAELRLKIAMKVLAGVLGIAAGLLVLVIIIFLADPSYSADEKLAVILVPAILAFSGGVYAVSSKLIDRRVDKLRCQR